MEIKLSLATLQLAALAGVQRRLRAIKAGRQARYGEPTERGVWDVDIEGAAAEMACAQALGVFWSDDPRLDYEGDVVSYQVRSTDLDHGCLLLHEGDDPDAIFVLVTGRAPTFTLRGWIRASEGKQDKFWAAHMPRPCWKIPQSQLRPMDELRSRPTA